MCGGYGTTAKVEAAAERWGSNAFEVPVPRFMELLRDQLLAPFFCFQTFCVGLWALDDYWCEVLRRPWGGRICLAEGGRSGGPRRAG